MAGLPLRSRRDATAQQGLPLLLAGAAAQAVLASFAPSPWWVPDLTLLALLVAVADAPPRWLLYGALAGWLSGVWMAQDAWVVVAAHIVLAAVIRIGTQMWDLTDRRIQRLCVGTLSLALWSSLAWLQDAWSLPMAGGLLLRSGLTVLALPLVARRWARPLAG